MVIKTKYFGDVEVDEKKVIHFKSGIPGFENLNKFLFMKSSKPESAFFYLQSIENIEIVFTIVDIFKILPNYNPIVYLENLQDFGEIENLEYIAIYNIANIPKNIEDITVNLKAPICINIKTNEAKQFICKNEEYPIKFKIYDLFKRKEGINVSFNKKKGR